MPCTECSAAIELERTLRRELGQGSRSYSLPVHALDEQRNREFMENVKAWLDFSIKRTPASGERRHVCAAKGGVS